MTLSDGFSQQLTDEHCSKHLSRQVNTSLFIHLGGNVVQRH